jgi:hypothetical protein
MGGERTVAPDLRICIDSARVESALLRSVRSSVAEVGG